MRGVEVERFLHAFECAQDRNDVAGLVTYVRRFGVLQECATQALEEATRRYKWRETAHLGSAPRCNAPHGVGQRADRGPHVDRARGGVWAERPGTPHVSGGAGQGAPGSRSNFFDRMPFTRA